MMMPKRGEIWLVRFPFSDLTSVKLRPALVWAIHGEDVILIGIFSRIPDRTKRKTWIVIEKQHGISQSRSQKDFLNQSGKNCSCS